MIIQKVKEIKEFLVLLQCGIDYNKDDLELDFITNKLFNIKTSKLTEIAKKNGYDKWSWNGFVNIENGTCEVKFQNIFKEEGVMKLQEKYNEWRIEIEENNKDQKEIGGSIPVYVSCDCGEAAVREDFSNYAELEKEIAFEEMLELENNYISII